MNPYRTPDLSETWACELCGETRGSCLPDYDFCTAKGLGASRGHNWRRVASAAPSFNHEDVKR